MRSWPHSTALETSCGSTGPVAFAVHALAQAEREPPLYGLWIGAIGAAVFASDCLDGRCRYPFLG